MINKPELEKLSYRECLASLARKIVKITQFKIQHAIQ